MFGDLLTRNNVAARSHRNAVAADTNVGVSENTPVASVSEAQAGGKHAVIGVLGAKGGVGATTTALNLSSAIGMAGVEATMIDANLQSPDAILMVGRAANFGLLELVERAADVDAQILSACSVPITEQRCCKLVSPPVSGEAAIKLQLSDVAECLKSIKTTSPLWIIDLPKHLDKHLVSLMDQCDQILLVLEPTLASINAAQRWQRIFKELEYPESKICPMINRWGGKVKALEEQMEALGSFEEFLKLPNCFEINEVSACVGRLAVTAHPRSPYARAVREMAAALLEKIEHE